MKKKSKIWKLYLNFIFPMIIAGFVTVGFFYWGYSLTKEIYPVPLTMFMSGCVGYIVGGMLTPKKKEEDENLSKLD